MYTNMWLHVTVIASLSISINSLLIVNETDINPARIIKLPATQTCLNIINFRINSDYSSELDTFLRIWHPKSVTIVDATNSTTIIPNLTCNLFVIFYEYIVEILQQINFKPFTKILMISKKLLNIENLQNFYFIKSINIMSVVDTSSVQNELDDFLNDQNFIDRLLRNERGTIALRASFFHCPPYVTISNRSGGEVHFDGIEMRYLREITRNWKLHYIDTTISLLPEIPSDLWERTLHYISENISDVAMCSIWQNNVHAALYDLSSYLNIQCVTVLVPKPSRITQAFIIYLPFETEVWLLFMSMMLLTAILIRVAFAIDLNIYSNGRDRKYNDFGRILLEMINISTSHGLFRFPYRLVIKLCFFGWILTMLLVDTTYSTGYTSIMTIPQYSKSIDTVSDFVKSRLRWSEATRLHAGIQQDIQNVGNPDYSRFANSLIVEENPKHRMNMLANKEIGKLVKVLFNKFVTELESVGDYAITMKPIKECIFNYYTGFAFQKDSSYKKIFDRQISRVKAAGLFQAWFNDIISQYFNETLMSQVLERYTKHKGEPQKLQLYHVVGGFYLLLIGLGLSSSVFCIEVVWKVGSRKYLCSQPSKGQ